MKKWLFIAILLVGVIGWGQTYKSLASEYWYKDFEPSKVEWLERDIVIGNSLITIISYGEDGKDIQRWTIQSMEKNIDTHTSNMVYYTHLASDEEMELPAIFTVIFNENDKVEIIESEIPPNKHLNLPKDSPTTIRFHID